MWLWDKAFPGNEELAEWGCVLGPESPCSLGHAMNTWTFHTVRGFLPVSFWLVAVVQGHHLCWEQGLQSHLTFLHKASLGKGERRCWIMPTYQVLVFELLTSMWSMTCTDATPCHFPFWRRTRTPEAWWAGDEWGPLEVAWCWWAFPTQHCVDTQMPDLQSWSRDSAARKGRAKILLAAGLCSSRL